MKKKKSIDGKVISRIEEMEAAYDKLAGIIGRLHEDLESFGNAAEEIGKLEDYLSSGNWLKSCVNMKLYILSHMEAHITLP